MARYFLDTSAVVKHYRQEAGTEHVDGLFAEPQAALVMSRLGAVETISALAMKVRTGELSQADYVTARTRFLTEVADGRLSVLRLFVAHYRGAERLLNRHAPTVRLRTLDALQLSVALDLWRLGRIDTFVSADGILCQLAGLDGLPVLNPLQP